MSDSRLGMFRSLKDWRQIIKEDLADEGVDVELSERQLDRALQNSLDLYNKYQPNKVWISVGKVGPTPAMVVTFQTPPEMIVDVQFHDALSRSEPGISPASFEYRWGVRGPRHYLELHTAERTYEYLTGEQPDWFWESITKTLLLYVPSRAVRVMALSLTQKTIEDIRYDQYSDFRQLVVGHSKLLLARILGKLGPFPVPQGTIQTDAAELRTEGKEVIDKIEQRLQSSLASYPTPRWVR